MIKSPLRYPGGKQKAIPKIVNFLPDHFSEYREPFIGGGSLFIYLKQVFPEKTFWVNDLNRELFLFWKYAQLDLNRLIKEVYRLKQSHQEGRTLFEILALANSENYSDLERAVRFFVLNRITFSGTIESGGYSEESFHKRFTYSSIKRLALLRSILDDVQITNLDYQEVVNRSGENVFIFLDPPYFKATKSKLYGKKGDLHLAFDHDAFAEFMERCPHHWLITYDDSPENRRRFENFAHIYTWEMQYGMNNYKQRNAAKGKELFITNYPVNQPQTEHQLALSL